jgi:hypothetical protein
MAELEQMPDVEDGGRSPLWRLLRIAGLGLVTLFSIGVVTGYVASHVERGKPFGWVAILVLVGTVLVALGCGWLLQRELRKSSDGGPLTRREKLNRNIIIGCGLLGFLLAILMMLGGDRDLARNNAFSDAPLPTGIAIVMVLLVGVLLPIVSVFWHRSAVDEQEADAYKTGALYALYVYMIGAPVWWFAWRGGFAPPPNGIAIYLITVATVGIIWMWKKYR